MRTTLDIEDTILKELKKVQQRDGGTLGHIVSRLLAEALSSEPRPVVPPLEWVSRPMKALVDLADKEMVYAILDRPSKAAEP